MKAFISPSPAKATLARLLGYFPAYRLGVTGLAIILAATAFTMKKTFMPVDAGELTGTWQVDLRPTPDAAPYYQEFVVTSVDGTSFTGKFYNSEIKHGKINSEWGVVTFAFTTSDGSGAYNTIGQLKNGKLEGATHSLGRKFLMPWRGERKNNTQK